MSAATTAALASSTAPADGLALMPGFEQRSIKTSGATINTLRGGSGPPLLLLHGYPQTHFLWHRIAPRLAERFTIVLTDLRGYGDSSKPSGSPDHITYSKRAMALDQVEVMRTLGFEKFAIVGHDRGARVTWRIAVEHPEVVTKAAVLDIIPKPYELQTKEPGGFGTRYFHWFFLIQDAPFPETLIGNSAELWLRTFLPANVSPAAFAEYLRCFNDPETIRASCEDYRAGASIDIQHAAEDDDKKVRCPLLVLWGSKGTVAHLYDVMAVWRQYAVDVRGKALACGHFLPEEAPEETLAELLAFFGGNPQT